VSVKVQEAIATSGAEEIQGPALLAESDPVYQRVARVRDHLVAAIAKMEKSKGHSYWNREESARVNHLAIRVGSAFHI
jgi:hypothetical protein